ncbi:MAG: ribosomal-processing cysteine protease Prp [Erysipelotrichia bacterium]|jgi:uncharacterized protein YsxB (DUF464 family)|nr:ribosomal-processing cysteine protease Prp [Bacilli bacterium]NLB49866.1 ribosomal-processing cysteine protease Prp [Erysipelotrichia bacterium]
MVHVAIKKEAGKFLSLKVKGHADSAPHGQDLVCSAISAVLTGGFNAIESKNNFHFRLNEGDAELIAKGPVSNHDEIVIETIITSLETIAEGKKKFIKIEIQ